MVVISLIATFLYGQWHLYPSYYFSKFSSKLVKIVLNSGIALSGSQSTKHSFANLSNSMLQETALWRGNFSRAALADMISSICKYSSFGVDGNQLCTFKTA